MWIRVWKRIKSLWTALGHIWLAKDLAVWVWGPTVGTALLTAAAVWAFTPASPFDLLLVMLFGGLVAFFLARRFAPKVRSIHHGNLTAMTAPQTSLGTVVNRGAVIASSSPPSHQTTHNNVAPWLLVNRFTVAQAASLWAGHFPGMSFTFDKGQHPNIAAAEQLIVTELRSRLDLTGAVLVVIGDYAQAHVDRADLCALAKRNNVQPPFLALGPGW